jgi:hypothetical protein
MKTLKTKIKQWFGRVVGLIDVLKKISCYIKLTFSSFSSKAYYNFLNLVPEKLNLVKFSSYNNICHFFKLKFIKLTESKCLSQLFLVWPNIGLVEGSCLYRLTEKNIFCALRKNLIHFFLLQFIKS